MSEDPWRVRLPAPAQAAWLDDHRIDGIAIVPAAVSALWLMRRLDVSQLEDVAWLRPLRVPEAGGLEVLVRSEAGQAHLEAPRIRPNGERFGRAVIARAHACRPPAPAPRPDPAALAVAPLADPIPWATPSSFHGASWRGLASGLSRGAEGLDAAARIGVPLHPAPWGLEQDEPRLLDLAFQAAGAAVVLDGGMRGWPARAARLAVLARPEEGEVLAIRVRRPAAASAMDVAVFGQDDRLLARVDGYRSAGALERTG